MKAFRYSKKNLYWLKKISNRDYEDPQYQKWRGHIRWRDRYHCQMPGCSSRGTICHHIKRWADCPALRFDNYNGITLCKEHHKMVTGKEEIYAPLFISIASENERKSKEKKIGRTRKNNNNS